MARGFRLLFVFGAGFAVLVLIQAYPAWRGLPDSATLQMSVLITCIQVGQTVAVQALLDGRWQLCRRSGALYGASALALVAWIAIPDLRLVALGLASVTAGIAFSAASMSLLHPDTMLRYQGRYLTRNLVLLAVEMCAIAGRLPPEDVVVAVALTALLGSLAYLACVDPLDRRPTTTWRLSSVLLLGCLSSLVYRNDVNLVRNAFTNRADFLTIHYALLLYAGVNALAGVCVTQFFYPRVRAGRPIAQFELRLLALAALTSLCLSVIVVILGVATHFNALLLLLAFCAIGCFSAVGTLLAATMHAQGRSWTVYVLGVLSVGVLLALLPFGAPTALLGENTFFIGATLMARRARTPTPAASLLTLERSQ